tara:strand:- start:752 stop:1936 length:1185 start_codon:yes stop_codon:yes gene_type:complete
LTENIARKKALRNWRFRDTFDLALMSSAHGMSDGYSNLMVPVLVLIVAEFSLSPVESGMLLSSLSLSVLLFQYPLSIYSDISGRRKVILLGGMLLATISYLLVGIVPNFYFLLLITFLVGVGNSVYHPCGTSMVARRFIENRAFAISIHGLGGNVGMAILPILLTFFAAFLGWRIAVVICVLPAIVFLYFIYLRFSDEIDKGDTERRKIKDILRDVFQNKKVVILAIAYMLRGMCTKGTVGFFPLLAASKNIEIHLIGIAISIHFILGAITKPLMGYLYDRVGARYSLMVPFFIAGLLVFAMPFTRTPTELITVFVLVGAVSHVSPIILTATADFADEKVLTSSVGFIYTCHGLNFISPLIGGVIASEVGLDSSYFFYSFAVLLGLWFVLKIKD